jgi:hypothetical protein
MKSLIEEVHPKSVSPVELLKLRKWETALFTTYASTVSTIKQAIEWFGNENVIGNALLAHRTADQSGHTQA